MSNPFFYLDAGKIIERVLPDPAETLIGDVHWGRAEEFFTPAFWLTQLWMCEHGNCSHRLGATFDEELAACLLGGHGLPAEVGLAAFERLRTRGLIDSLCVDETILSEALREPLIVHNRPVVYRFWLQRSRYLATAFRHLRSHAPPTESAIALREYLLAIPGIGPKTSSWIVRNWLTSDDVAILDIHIVRAGVLMGLFQTEHRLPRDYMMMEKLFLCFARRMGVSTAALDAVIWQTMRECPSVVAEALESRKVCSSLIPNFKASTRSKQVPLPLN